MWHNKPLGTIVVTKVRVNKMIALGLLALLFQLHVVVSKAAGNLTGDLRIVGGTDADAFPTLAFSAGSKLCAATLIYPEYVLSTAMIQMNIHLTYSYNVYTTILIKCPYVVNQPYR